MTLSTKTVLLHFSYITKSPPQTFLLIALTTMKILAFKQDMNIHFPLKKELEVGLKFKGQFFFTNFILQSNHKRSDMYVTVLESL